MSGEASSAPPRASAHGSLCHYITHADPANYQPANISFDLLPPLCSTTPPRLGRKERRARQCQIALTKWNQWLAQHLAPPSQPSPAPVADMPPGL